MLPFPFLVLLFICVLSAYCGQGPGVTIPYVDFQERMCSQSMSKK